MGVGGAGGPAQQVEAGVAPQDLRKVADLGFRLQVDLDADAREVGGHCLANRGVVDVAVVRAVHADLEAVRVTGVGQHFLGSFGVVRQALVHLGHETAHARPDHQRGRRRGAAHHARLDRVDVDGLVERLADAFVLERVLALDAAVEQLIALLVHAEEDRAQLRALQHGEVGARLDALHVLQRHRFHHVALARQQRGDAGRVVADRREDDLVEIAVDLVPVGEVLDDRRAHRGLALFQAERAGAVGLEAGGVLDALAPIDRALGLVLFTPGLAHHREHGERVGQDRKRRERLDVDHVLADLAHLLDRRDVAAHVAAGVGRALEAEDDVVGSERRAVVEFHALAQLEAPNRGRGLRPLGSEQRLHRHVLATRNQRLVDVAHEAELQRFVQRVRVHRLHVALVRDAQGHGLRRGNRQAECGQQQGLLELHGCLLKKVERV